MGQLNKTTADINLIIGAIRVTEGVGSQNINIGFSGNSISEGVNTRANTISGGGYVGQVNKINGEETRYATIGGGYDNFIDGENSTESLDGTSSTIGGGSHNIIKSTHATIGGGSNGNINAGCGYATIGGGTENSIAVNCGIATIAGGNLNTINGLSGTIGGGFSNDITAQYGTISGGLNNEAGEYAFSSGYLNVSSGLGSVTLGRQNIASNLYSVAIGMQNTVSGERSFAFNYMNTVSGDYSGAMGREINVSGNYSFGMALSDQNGAEISQANTFAILGGKVGVDVAAPTAKLHLTAGTATAGTAPLKLTSGVNLTTPENGAFEFDGTNLYFTSGGTRKTITMS